MTLTLKHGWGRTYAQLRSFGYLPFNPHVDLFQKAFANTLEIPRETIPQVLLQVHAILVVATRSPEADEFTAKERRHLTFKMDCKSNKTFHVHDSRYVYVLCMMTVNLLFDSFYAVYFHVYFYYICDCEYIHCMYGIVSQVDIL